MQKLEEIKGIGPKTLILLKKLNINNIDELINFYPFRYEVIKRSDLKNLKQDDKIIIDGIIESIPNITYFKQKRNKMTFRLNVGQLLINVIIFNRAFLKPKLNIKTKVTVIGKYDKFHNNIIASDIRFEELGNTEKIEGVYHATYGLSGSKIKSYIFEVLEKYQPKNYLPEEIIVKYNFMNKKEALLEIHNPTNNKKLEKAIERLKYEELFLFMLQMNYLKLGKNEKRGIKREIEFKKVKEFMLTLSFSLTEDQLIVINDIYNDLISNNKMNRLLQGDVGSGKTIVAIISMYINYLSGYMSAMMAPTEVLAFQHYETIKQIFQNYNLKIYLLTGNLKKSEKEKIAHLIKKGEVDILIGTHALITDNLDYYKLGLVITDEQHRFGVNQRNAFRNKGENPDILYMSATPIPRTYALTLYGDMDISNIKTMPKGRKNVITILKKETEEMDVLKLMYQELKRKHQIYVVVPLIEESNNFDMEWIEKIEQNLNYAFGRHFKIKSLHGKMGNEEKEEIMEQFKNNKIQILISTTIIEVGIDVANATMIVIYDSYRFGLSTLHQLRGRVGRSNLDSYCILISDYETKRLEILTKTNDGFIISEEDFKLRGSGDLFGVRQSGDMNFKIANIKQDYQLLLKAKEDSLLFLRHHQDINKIKNPFLKEIIIRTSELG